MQQPSSDSITENEHATDPWSWGHRMGSRSITAVHGHPPVVVGSSTAHGHSTRGHFGHHPRTRGHFGRREKTRFLTENWFFLKNSVFRVFPQKTHFSAGRNARADLCRAAEMPVCDHVPVLCGLLYCVCWACTTVLTLYCCNDHAVR